MADGGRLSYTGTRLDPIPAKPVSTPVTRQKVLRPLRRKVTGRRAKKASKSGGHPTATSRLSPRGSSKRASYVSSPKSRPHMLGSEYRPRRRKRPAVTASNSKSCGRRLPALSGPAADQSLGIYPFLALLALVLVLYWLIARRFRSADKKRRCSLADLEANLQPGDYLQVD